MRTLIISVYWLAFVEERNILYALRDVLSISLLRCQIWVIDFMVSSILRRWVDGMITSLRRRVYLLAYERYLSWWNLPWSLLRIRHVVPILLARLSTFTFLFWSEERWKKSRSEIDFSDIGYFDSSMAEDRDRPFLVPSNALLYSFSYV